MAGEKALYDGHAVAAVAATTPLAAKKALRLIEVEYEVLAHVTDVDAAMKPGAPELRPGDPKVEGMSSNVMSRVEFGHGDLDEGFAEADMVMEKTFHTAATHQGYIEPHAAVGSLTGDGRGELWCCTQGHFVAPQHLRRFAGHRGGVAAGHRLGDRRRFRRQDHRLRRASRTGPQPQVRTSRESGDEPRGGLPGDRADLVLFDRCQDRHEE